MYFILASGSPRRKELFSLISQNFNILIPDTDESFPASCAIADAAAQVAARKARRAFSLSEGSRIIVAADTVVTLDGSVLGKPSSYDDARAALTLLSGRKHTVITGVGVIAAKGSKVLAEEVFSEETQVEFYPLSSEEIERYIATGEPMDKAGSYGIQGHGSLFVKSIFGDYFNVVGLPVAALNRKITPILSLFEK